MLTIKSRILGSVFEFKTIRSSYPAYLYISIDGSADIQVCKGGYLMGSAITVYSDKDLIRTSRSWYRKFLTYQKNLLTLPTNNVR